MQKNEWKTFFEKVKVGDILLIPKAEINKSNIDTTFISKEGKFKISDILDENNNYEAIVLFKNDIGIVTTLSKYPLHQPLSWSEDYNFSGTKILKNMNKEFTQELIEKITPYQQENFITFPLFEEGNFMPAINFWQIFKEIPFDIDYELTQQLDFIPEYISLDYEIQSYNSKIEYKNNTFNIVESDEEIYLINFSVYMNTDPTISSEYDLNEMLKIVLSIIEKFKNNL